METNKENKPKVDCKALEQAKKAKQKALNTQQIIKKDESNDTGKLKG